MPSGVHAVERLIHHQHRRVTEHGGGDPQPLPHAQGVPARLPPDHRLQARLLDHRIDPPGGQALRMGQPQQVVAGGAAGLQRGRVQQCPTWLSGWRRLAYGWPPISAVPWSAASRPRITRIVVDFPAPLGPTKPVTWPGWTVNVHPSSATAGPNLLRSPDTR